MGHVKRTKHQPDSPSSIAGLRLPALRLCLDGKVSSVSRWLGTMPFLLNNPPSATALSAERDEHQICYAKNTPRLMPQTISAPAFLPPQPTLSPQHETTRRETHPLLLLEYQSHTQRDQHNARDCLQDFTGAGAETALPGPTDQRAIEVEPTQKDRLIGEHHQHQP